LLDAAACSSSPCREERQEARITSVELCVLQNFSADISAWKSRWSREGEGVVRGKLPTEDIVLSLWDYEKPFRKGQEFCY